MAVVESDTTICIMTERVKPLRSALQVRQYNDAQEKEDWLLWGLHRISVSWATFIRPSYSIPPGGPGIYQ